MLRVLVGVIGVALAGVAHAEVRVQAQGPCDAASMRTALAALGTTTDDDRIARIETRRVGTTLEADVTLTTSSGDPIGSRRVEAHSCKELSSAIALVIVVSLSESESESESESGVVLETAVKAVPLPLPVPVPVPVPGTSPLPPSVESAIDVLIGADADVFRHASLVAGARFRRGRVSLGLEVNRSTQTRVDVGDSGRVRVARTFGALLPCGHVGRLALCGVGAVGEVTGRGDRLADASTARRAVILAGARAEWTLAITDRIGVSARVDALQALRSSRFLVDQMPVWSSQPHELRIGLGMVAHFP